MGSCLSIRRGPNREHVQAPSSAAHAALTTSSASPPYPQRVPGAKTARKPSTKPAGPPDAAKLAKPAPATLPSIGIPHTPTKAPTASVASTAPPTTLPPRYAVFISHAAEDKSTIAIPLRKKLASQGITAFVDEQGLWRGAHKKGGMVEAMETAAVAVFVLSPEFVARKCSMQQLMTFLRRREQSRDSGCSSPVIIPFFYRLKIAELFDEPRLDRTDGNGNLLYRTSRFFERLEDGEPEADIAGIKVALNSVRGIVGVSNDVVAANEPGYVMSRRREMLLEEVFDMVRQALVAETPVMTVKGRHRTIRDAFHAHFDVPFDISELVFDFVGKDDSGNALTQEGKTLELLLDESQNVNTAIAVSGIAGVGKTSLLRAVRSLQRVRKRFRDGVYDISLGMDAPRALIEALIVAVQHSGGEATADSMRGKTDVRKVMDLFRSWFAKKECLFVVDDVRETEEVPSGTIRELMKLHISGRDSKVLLTTRSVEIASWAGTSVGLEPRDALEYESRAILLHYSGIELKRSEEGDKKVVDQILERCQGLPLFLAIAGKALKALSFRRGRGGCVSYHVYAQSLKTSMQSLPTTDVGSYESLSAQLMISVKLLEEERQNFGFRVDVSVAEMHRRLSVVTKQTRVPMKMLKHLWNLENESQAAVVAREFEQVGLADLDFDRERSRPVELLRVHDSIYDFAVKETQIHREERLGHELLLRGYSRGIPVKQGFREWWSTCLEVDAYIHGNLCRHLLAVGRKEEVIRLLLKPQWTERQLMVNGAPFLEGDFSHGIKAVQNRIGNETDEERAVKEKAQRLISEAATLSSTFILRNFGELRFQMHGRLKGYGENCRAIREYVHWMETDPPRPVVLCLNDFLREPGGTSTRIVSTGASLSCMIMLNDRARVACGSLDGRILVVNVLRSKVESEWKAHCEGVAAMAVTRDGSRIVSGSLAGTARVWEAESGRLLASFEGHTRAVKSVAVTEDGRRVISGSSDGTARVWDIDTGRAVLPPFTGHQGSVQCVAVLGDKEHVVSGGWDKKLILWSVKTGAQVGAAFYGHDYWVTCLAVTRQGRGVVSGSWDGTIRVWHAGSHQQIGESLQGHTRGVECVAVNGDGRRILSGSSDKRIRIWDSKSGKEVCDPLEGHGQTVTGVSFLGNSDSIVSCSRDGTVRVWVVRRENAGAVAKRHASAVTSVAFTPDGTFVVSGSHDETLRVWESKSARQVGHPLEGHSSLVNAVAVTPNGRWIVSGSQDKTVRVWDLKSRKLLHTLTGHTHVIQCLAVTPQGDRAVTGSPDRTVLLWNLAAMDGSPVALEGHSASVERVFVSDDGLKIVSVDGNHKIFVWKIKTQTLIKRCTAEHAARLSRREVLGIIGEPTVQDDAGLSIPLFGREIVYEGGSGAQVLATMESDVHCWALSPDKKTICLGLQDGNVAFLKLER